MALAPLQLYLELWRGILEDQCDSGAAAPLSECHRLTTVLQGNGVRLTRELT